MSGISLRLEIIEYVTGCFVTVLVCFSALEKHRGKTAPGDRLPPGVMADLGGALPTPDVLLSPDRKTLLAANHAEHFFLDPTVQSQ